MMIVAALSGFVLGFAVSMSANLTIAILPQYGEPSMRGIAGYYVFYQLLRLVEYSALPLGLLISLLAAPRMADLLFETSPRDPRMLLGVAGVMGVVTVLAAAVPALRATRVDPSIALRSE